MASKSQGRTRSWGGKCSHPAGWLLCIEKKKKGYKKGFRVYRKTLTQVHLLALPLTPMSYEYTKHPTYQIGLIAQA